MSTTDISNFMPRKDQLFIMDTNVLLKLLYPSFSDNKSIFYEGLYQKILKVGARFIISSIQISEFVNRCIRFQFGLWKNEQDRNVDFKNDYRESDDYRNSMQAILEIITSDILPYSTCIDDGFSKMDAKKLYQYGFSYDFNDAVVSEIARIHNATLITDDRDFGNYSSHVNIVTGNKTLLMFH